MSGWQIVAVPAIIIALVIALALCRGSRVGEQQVQQDRSRSWPANGSPRFDVAKGPDVTRFYCPRCYHTGGMEELLDGETCPRCKLVL